MRRWSPLAVALPLLAGCARQELYVVLPNADGRPGSGAIAVSDGRTTTALDQPYATAESRQGDSAPLGLSNGNAYVIFHQASGARPVLPHRFRLYFELGSDQPTAESLAAYSGVLADIRARRAAEVRVVGYTDTLGGGDYNDRLSLARATVVRDMLSHDGIAVASVSIAGRGELDPLVPTADEVAEPRNRRADILVR